MRLTTNIQLMPKIIVSGAKHLLSKVSSCSTQGQSYLYHYYLANSARAEILATSSKELSQNSMRSWLTLPFTVHGIPDKFRTYYLMLTCLQGDRKHILYILSCKSNYNTICTIFTVVPCISILSKPLFTNRWAIALL